MLGFTNFQHFLGDSESLSDWRFLRNIGVFSKSLFDVTTMGKRATPPWQQKQFSPRPSQKSAKFYRQISLRHWRRLGQNDGRRRTPVSPLGFDIPLKAKLPFFTLNFVIFWNGAKSKCNKTSWIFLLLAIWAWVMRIRNDDYDEKLPIPMSEDECKVSMLDFKVSEHCCHITRGKNWAR